jgi:4-nitrophenyl phosphatase
LIRKGLPFIGTNPDVTFPSADGITPGAGAILAALQAASGVAPEIAGKPERPMYDQALARLGTRPEETISVGDRLETDIDGGQRLGLRTALVLSGISTREEAQAWQPRPDLIAEDLTQLLG